MKLYPLLFSEGGWASSKTQGTKLTPKLLADARSNLKQFETELNEFLQTENLEPIEIGKPVGSGTYYERDLEVNPTKEYGDIDVAFYIPRLPETTPNQNITTYTKAVENFCNQSNGRYETENGANVIFQLDSNRFVQVDLVAIFHEHKDWATALTPEWNTKGVLSASLLSALAEALSLSIGSQGVQAKTINNKLVKFNISKGTKLHTISTNKANWAVDIAKFLGSKKLSPSLLKNPGMKDETKIVDIIASIKGIAESLGNPELLSTIKTVYLNKINKIIASSKFDKAETPDAIKKADETKKMLAKKSNEIASLLGN